MVMYSVLLYICTNFMKYIPVHTMTVSHNLSVCLKTKSDILILSQIQILQIQLILYKTRDCCSAPAIIPTHIY